MKLSEARKVVEQTRGRKIELENSIDLLLNKIRKEKKRLKNLEKAHEILKQVGLETQQQLVYHISDVTSVALSSVFDEPYSVKLDFVERRGKTECDIIFEKNGFPYDPLNSAGGGVADLASFALRIASWSMKVPNTRPIIVLDEPFKHLDKTMHPRASEMIKMLSDKLGIQFIIITHEQSMGVYADKVFEVKQRKSVSTIKQI